MSAWRVNSAASERGRKTQRRGGPEAQRGHRPQPKGWSTKHTENMRRLRRNQRGGPRKTRKALKGGGPRITQITRIESSRREKILTNSYTKRRRPANCPHCAKGFAPFAPWASHRASSRRLGIYTDDANESCCYSRYPGDSRAKNLRSLRTFPGLAPQRRRNQGRRPDAIPAWGNAPGIRHPTSKGLKARTISPRLAVRRTRSRISSERRGSWLRRAGPSAFLNPAAASLCPQTPPSARGSHRCSNP